MARAKSEREAELEQKVAQMAAQMELMAKMVTAPRVTTGQAVVGIRNVSSYTVGFVSPVAGEGEFQLAADLPDHHGRGQHTATVTNACWQWLKQRKLVRMGMIMRDDSILGPDVARAPEDRETDFPEEYFTNLILDPIQWIDSKTEDELKDAIATITSEASLRRLDAAVTRRIWEIGERDFKDDPQRGKKAVRALPSKYHYVDALVSERLDELNPASQTRHLEPYTKADFRGLM